MADRINLHIVTPDGAAREQAAQLVSVPTDFGSVGILADHAPMLCAVKKGVLRLRCESGEQRRFLVGDGVARVEENEVTLLVRSVEEII